MRAVGDWHCIELTNKAKYYGKACWKAYRSWDGCILLVES